MEEYTTSQVAAMAGVHPNTVRFYEKEGLLPEVPRASNGYRVFSSCHVYQLKLIRLAFRAEILSNNLRSMAVEIVKTAAKKENNKALEQAVAYKESLETELGKAEEAISLAAEFTKKADKVDEANIILGRKAAAAQIEITMDVLRDWERNGLITVSRGNTGRRQYGIAEMNRLKIIHILRNAHYSQMSIRRMLLQLEEGERDLRRVIDTPEPQEDIISVTDRYISSLQGALEDANRMIDHITGMKEFR